MPRPVTRRSEPEQTGLPQWIRPQLTGLVDAAPDGPAWLHEIKFDGYRMHARLDHGAVRLGTISSGSRPFTVPGRRRREGMTATEAAGRLRFAAMWRFARRSCVDY
jgi:hypothetical protein